MGALSSSFSTDPETGQMRVLVSDKDLPAFLVSAKAAIEAGRLEEAADLLNEQAVEHVEELVGRDLSRTDISFMLALMLDRIGRPENAERWYRAVVERDSNALAFHKLADICVRTERLFDAIRHESEAVRSAPGNTRFLTCLAIYLLQAGRTQEGLDKLRKVVETEPDNSDAHSKLLFHMHYLPDLNPKVLLDEHKRWAQMHAPAIRDKTSHKNTPDPNRRLRVGYISSDFHTHSVAYNFEPFLSGRDSDAVEVYGYGNVQKQDQTTERLKQQFDCYRDIRGIKDQEAARLIERDKIDILVEIGGHTGNNRLGVLAYKPAPIQVDYGGLNTTGMEQIDYRLTDDLLDPPAMDGFYVEESVRLPGGLFCYSPPDYAPSVAPSPVHENGFITFGSFNNNMKMNPHITSLWAQVLRTNNDSHLLLKYAGGNDADIKEEYISQFEQFGIDRRRVEICGWQSPVEHLRTFGRVDIALDTYPFNGCVTTLEGLWMGVPVVSLVGNNSLLSRTGLSILSRLDMQFFAASTPKEYVSKAVALAQNPDALAGIRSTLRQRMTASTLCNGPYYARRLEEVYRKMWRKWCRNHRSAISQRQHTPEDFARSAEAVPRNGTLDFFISDNSDLQLTVHKAGLPSSLLKAAKAVKAGNVAEATDLLDGQTANAVEQMVRDDPGRTDALFMLAALFAKTGDIQKAEQYYREILAHRPHPLVLFELANICRDTGRLSEAVRFQQQAVELSPNSPELWTTLAEYLIRIGRTQEGIDLLRKAVEAKADKVNHSKYLWHLHQAPLLTRLELFEEHKRWARVHAPMSFAKTSHNNSRDPDRRLNVGYVSPDFCGHSVSYFFEALLDTHNRQQVQVYGYGNIPRPDQVTEHLKGEFDHYRNVCGLKNDKVAHMIEQDSIDILVDLAGHTSGNSLGVFARKPAPIQVTYLGFPDTTGMEQIDYRLTDELADLPEAQQFHTEKLIFLPSGFLCYKPPGFAPAVAPLPAIEKGCFTFGSFNNNCKIQPDMIRLWAQILRSKENSQLLLKFGGGDDEAVRSHYLEQFRDFGITPDRIRICGRKATVEHLRMYNHVDIALDTYPYNGTTTTCEAMWMGVPTLSLVGDRHSSRVGLSILTRVGLQDFAATAPEEYVGKALAFSGELESLAKIRKSLRTMMFNSPLCDKKSFTRSLEDAYRKMWHKWCEKQNSKIAGGTAEQTL